MVNKELILKYVKQHTSFYLYEETQIIQAISKLKENFQGVKFLYSVKSNSNGDVVNSIISQGLGVDAASVTEVRMGAERGVPLQDIQYSAPGKSKTNIRDTIHISRIIADSFHEIDLIQEVAEEQHMIAKIGIRINPAFSFDGDEGASSKFGIDEEQIFKQLQVLKLLPNVKIVGLHIHIKSQELNPSRIETYYEKVLELAKRLQIELDNPLEFINMGSGIGIPYQVTDEEVDIQRLGEKTTNLIASLQSYFSSAQLYIETGRYVVGKSGIYVTTVLDKKTSHGETYVVLQNILNGYLRLSLAQLVAKYSKQKENTGSEPLYTTGQPAEIFVLNEEIETESVTLVGNLCTATDVAAIHKELPKLQIGDIVVFTNAGSYAAVLSPMQFSSQEPPAEIFVASK